MCVCVGCLCVYVTLAFPRPLPHLPALPPPFPTQSITTARYWGATSRQVVQNVVGLMLLMAGFALIVTGSTIEGSCDDDPYSYYNDDCTYGAAIWGPGIPVFITGCLWIAMTMCCRPTVVHMSGLDERNPELFTLPLPRHDQADRMRSVILDLKHKSDPIVLANSGNGAGVASPPQLASSAPEVVYPSSSGMTSMSYQQPSAPKGNPTTMYGQ